MTNGRIFGGFGWGLLFTWAGLTIIFYLVLPSALSASGLSFPAKYVSTVRSWMTLAISLWASQTIISTSRGIIWLLASSGETRGTQYMTQLRDSKNVQTLSLWSLGIATALSAYLAGWFS